MYLYLKEEFYSIIYIDFTMLNVNLFLKNFKYSDLFTTYK